MDVTLQKAAAKKEAEQWVAQFEEITQNVEAGDLPAANSIQAEIQVHEIAATTNVCEHGNIEDCVPPSYA